MLLLTSDLHEKGRVLALLRDVDVDLSSEATAGVTGMAYEVEEEDWPAVLEALDIRERHGYTRRMGNGCVCVCGFTPKKWIVTFWLGGRFVVFVLGDALTWRLVGDLHSEMHPNSDSKSWRFMKTGKHATWHLKHHETNSAGERLWATTSYSRYQ